MALPGYRAACPGAGCGSKRFWLFRFSKGASAVGRLRGIGSKISWRSNSGECCDSKLFVDRTVSGPPEGLPQPVDSGFCRWSCGLWKPDRVRPPPGHLEAPRIGWRRDTSCVDCRSSSQAGRLMIRVSTRLPPRGLRRGGFAWRVLRGGGCGRVREYGQMASARLWAWNRLPQSANGLLLVHGNGSEEEAALVDDVKRECWRRGGRLDAGTQGLLQAVFWRRLGQDRR